MDAFITKFTGVHSALITPFDSQERLDLNALAELVLSQKMDGMFGVVIAGTTGEAPTLTLDERVQLVRTAKDHAGSMVVTAGAGVNCTRSAINLQKSMEDAGADATLQVVPYYNKPNPRGLFEHFSSIAKAARIPIILYNAAGRTGIDMAPATIAALASEHENIIGVKDANTNIERLIDLIKLTKQKRPDFLVLSGEDSGLLPFLTLGGDGAIAVSSHIAGYEMLAMYNSFRNGDLRYAQKIAQKLNGLFKLVFSHTNPIPIKTILARMNLVEKTFRLPLVGLSEAEEQELIAKCQEFAFLKSFKTRGFLQ
jgi:4-hydroxy-tetrahydrodipicolinate synthase